MSVDSFQSASFLISQFLVWENIAVADATTAQRADALTKLNLAMFEVFRGAYYDEQNRVQFHNWSFLNVLDTTSHVFAVDAYVDDLPSDWQGQIGEDVIYAYDSSNSKTGLDIKRISNKELEEKRRDSTTSGTPAFFTIRQKAFTAAGGSTWQIAIHPPTDTQVTIKNRYHVDTVALTDSSSIYPRGLPGMAALILQEAKAAEERFVGQVGQIGPERGEANRLLLKLVRRDQERVGDEHVQTSYTETDPGISG